MSVTTRSPRTSTAPSLLTYADIRIALRMLDGEPIEHVRKLVNSIFDQGSSSPFDWPAPGRGINEQLNTLARKCGKSAAAR